jgi:manganese oxidase
MTRNLFFARLLCGLMAVFALLAIADSASAQCDPNKTIHADVVALDQPFMLNRLGAAMPQGMIFALRQDVIATDGSNNLKAGQVMLRPDKKPRPIVLRVNQGGCLQVTLINLLSPTAETLQPATREISLHANGLQLVTSISDDGSYVGINPNIKGSNTGSLIPPKGTPVGTPPAPSPGTATYTLYASQVGTFLLYSMGATFDAAALAGQISAGMFGAVHVQPAGAEYYRSQVTNADLQLATNPDGTINYDAHYPSTTYDPKHPNTSCGAPILKMVDARRIDFDKGVCLAQPDTTQRQLYSSDLTAIITGPAAGPFTPDPNDPVFAPVAASPNRTQPWREITIIYHEVHDAVQAFKEFYSPPSTTLGQAITPSSTSPIKVGSTTAFPASGTVVIDTEYIQYVGTNNTQLGTTQIVRGVDGTTAAAHAQSASVGLTPDLSTTLAAGMDNFAINYGTGGIGAEILANRFRVGPMANCVECKFEEFFLSSWAIGDPAMAVDIPANSPTYLPNQTNVASPFLTNMENLAVNGAAKSPLPPTPANPNTKPPTPANPTNDPNICSIPGYDTPCLKATKAFYPDDPSNVYHSYLSDHVKFQILNAGAWLTHVHHQHAHQWLHTPNNTNSSYLDSQMISPGAAFTLEMVYDGSGNRNKTVGDSIFHCHFYPHFAAGMWALWRVHDTFEAGTVLDPNTQMPVTGTWNRALPDGEIATGAPIPGVVPIPTLAMAPAPAKVQICPAFENWQTGNLVGTSCPPRPSSNSPVIGYATMVNSDDLNHGLNPGFPFFVPGIAGHRAPHPPLDFAYAIDPQTGQKNYYDGGLPRHLILKGTVNHERHNQWDFSKDIDAQTGGTLNALQLPEQGTAVEQAAMAFMGQRNHPSKTPGGQSAFFVVNGLPRKPSAGYQAENQYGSQLGAPFADPGVLEDGTPIGNTRRYKAAVIQNNVTFNKAGWHFPQQRFETLWQDVAPTIANNRSPEPLFFRTNSLEDVIEFWHTNLVPDYYELDDFQVRTPTDILGQHIHLVKFDVMASDGAANGFNYEDGTLSPNDVFNRIGAINNGGGLYSPDRKTQTTLKAKPAPAVFGKPPDKQDWTGAQTTVQRWYADPLQGCPNAYEGCAGKEKADRTMRTVFTHDHFGPSTHQQAGLYSGLVIEPEGSKWINPETNEAMYTRDDGGPTSWQANILTRDLTDSYREFVLEFQDLALAYKNVSTPAPTPYPGDAAPLFITPQTPKWGWADCPNAINGGKCSPLAAQPALISNAQGTGTASVNYRNEPLSLRVTSASGNTNPNTIPNSADLSYAFSSIQRSPAYLNTQPTLGSPINPSDPNNKFVFPGGFAGATGWDPYTPLLRAYQNDKVQVRLLVGAHLWQHSFGMHGLKWLFEPSNSTSGWRDNQAMGISEHFELLFTVPSSLSATMNNYFKAPPPSNPVLQNQQPVFADYLYMPGSGTRDLGNGLWGILRAYNTGGDPKKLLPDLQPLPYNNPHVPGQVPPLLTTDVTCPSGVTPRTYYVAAINSLSGTGSTATPVTITYNNRNPSAPLTNGNSLVYVLADSSGNPQLPKDKNGNPLPPTDPIVLRAAAGECIEVTVFNRFNTSLQPFNPTGGSGNPSVNAGLHPQLVSFDVTQSNAANIGFNPDQTVPPPQPGGSINSKTYRWYAGTITTNSDGTVTRKPAEFGAVNLLASDPLQQQPYSLIGSLIIEPSGSTWCSGNNPQNCSGAAPGVTVSGTTVDVSYSESSPPSTVVVKKQFREFAAIMQNNLINPSGFLSINFGSEPMTNRFPASANFDTTDIAASFSNNLVMAGTSPPNAGCPGDPYTPVFTAIAGSPVRFRLLHPDGLGGFPDSVWTIHGHVWQEEPYVDGCLDPVAMPCPNDKLIPSARLGFNPLSQWMGSRDGFGPGNHFDISIDKAGGNYSIPGDYLYRSYPSQEFLYGNWGIFRVLPPNGIAPCRVEVVTKARRPQPPRVRPMAAAAPLEITVAGAPSIIAPPAKKRRSGSDRFLPPEKGKVKPQNR